MKKILDIARVVRSKNSGPYELVLDIMLKNRELFDALRQSEQQQMASLCALPAVQSLLGTDAVLVRRFVDRHDTLFFETELPVSECPAPPA